jgi:DmsE family decaheme c-type cytochrome
MADYTGADADMVGSDTCVMCHQDYVPGNVFSHQSILDNDPGSDYYGYGCEGCHGPGGNHMGDPAGIINPPMLDSEGITDLCSNCHDSLREYDYQEWTLSEHYYLDASCLECHGGHSDNDDFLQYETAEELCYTCHTEKRAEFSMRAHHPVEEGLMGCNSCHNPHSGMYDGQLIADGSELCYSCHGDKEGPFIYDHPAGMAAGGDGCMTCHFTHGSNSDSLLRLPHRVCQQCHTDKEPTTHHPGTCWSAGCHVEVHGSNSHPLFFD